MIKSYVLAMAIITTIVAGAILTGNLVEAKPQQDGDGDGELEGIVFEILGLLQGQEDELSDINEKTGFKVVEFDIQRNPAENTNERVFILPFVEGHAYTGHMEIFLVANSGNTVTLACGAEDRNNTAFLIDVQIDGASLDPYERDFTCSFLSVSFTDRVGGGDAGGSTVKGILSYLETNEVSMLT